VSTIFQEEARRTADALIEAEGAKRVLEQDRDRLRGLLVAETMETQRLQRLSDEQARTIEKLERDVGIATKGAEFRAELERERDEANSALARATDEAAKWQQSALQEAARADRLTTELGAADERVRDLEKELIPTRALVAALKEQIAVAERVRAEVAKLGD